MAFLLIFDLFPFQIAIYDKELIVTKKYANLAYFFVLRLVTLPQPGLGRIAEQVQVLVA